MSTSALPTPYENVMITYKKTFATGPYGDGREVREVTKMGFWTGEKFAIPPGWAKFRMGDNLVLLPDGFGGDHLPADKIISWKPINP